MILHNYHHKSDNHGMALQMFDEYGHGHIQMTLGHVAHRGDLPLLEAGNMTMTTDQIRGTQRAWIGNP
jgi:hypothetical protein